MKHICRSLLLITLFGLIVFSSIAQKGVIKGNVFYKYNDFVGNRADAGSLVYLFYLHNKQHYKEATADISGNFSFENLDTGKYLIAVKSKTVSQRPEKHIEQYKYISTQDWFGIGSEEQVQLYLDSTLYYKRLYDSAYLNKPRKRRDFEEQKSKQSYYTSLYINSAYKINDLLNNSPYKDLSFPLFELSGLSSIEFKEVQITPQNNTINLVIDFGITYF